MLQTASKNNFLPLFTIKTQQIYSNLNFNVNQQKKITILKFLQIDLNWEHYVSKTKWLTP